MSARVDGRQGQLPSSLGVRVVGPLSIRALRFHRVCTYAAESRHGLLPSVSDAARGAEIYSLLFRLSGKIKLAKGEAMVRMTKGNIKTASISDEQALSSFELSSTPTEAQHLFVREVIDRTVGKHRRKQPHQAMTVKIPYADYARVTRVREGWELNQTDLIRFFFELALPILESPPEDMRALLEQHRERVRTQRANEAKKRSKVASLLSSQQSLR
jgi:hypothetical protein